MQPTVAEIKEWKESTVSKWFISELENLKKEASEKPRYVKVEVLNGQVVNLTADQVAMRVSCDQGYMNAIDRVFEKLEVE